MICLGDAVGGSSSVVILISGLGSPAPRLFSARTWTEYVVAGCNESKIPVHSDPSTLTSGVISDHESPTDTNKHYVSRCSFMIQQKFFVRYNNYNSGKQ